MSAINLLHKSTLAIAIASASLSAYSEEFVLSDTKNHIIEVNEQFTDGLLISGQTAFTASEQIEAAINIIDSTSQGDVVLDTKLNVSGPSAKGLALSSLDKQSIINGNLINKGQIDFNGDLGWGIMVHAEKDDVLAEHPTLIEGDLINQGSINITQQENAEISLKENDAATAIEVGHAHVNHIRNEHQINLKGDNVTGIYVTAKSEVRSITNTGSISGSGKNLRGIYVDDRSNVSSIENNGQINLGSSGTTPGIFPSGGIVVAGAKIHWLDNQEHGVIDVSGAGLAAIYAKEATIEEIENVGVIRASKGATGIKSVASELEDVTNDGLIEVSGQGAAGIHIVDSSVNTGILNGGDIKTSDGAVAIKVENTNTHFKWDGGTIQGDIQGITSTKVKNNVTFAGKNFESKTLVVGSKKHPTTLIFTQPHSVIKTDKNSSTELNGTTYSGGLHLVNGANLALEISQQTNPEQAIVAVEGAASFAQGTGIQVSSAQGLSIDGKDYILLSTTESLKNDGVQVTGNALLKVNSYNVSNNQITANVSVETNNNIIENVIKSGGNKNNQAVAKELNTLIGNLPESTFKQHLISAGDSPEQLLAAVEELTPEMNGGAIQAASSGQTLLTSVTGTRTSSLRGQSSGDIMQDAGVWVQTLYSDARQAKRDDIKGYNAYSSGIAIGVDAKPSDDLTVGVAYSYLDTSVKGKSNNQTEVKGHAFTLYGGYEIDNYFVDGNLTYSSNKNDSKRQVLNTTAKGSYDSDMLGASLTAGYTFQLNNNLTLEPLLTARYANIKIDSYSEKGSPAALRTNSQRYEVAELGLGARASSSYALGQGTLEPSVQVMALHDLAADQTRSTSAFIAAGGPFVAYGSKPVRNSYEAAIGADYRLGAFTFGANYGYTGKSGYNADTFSAKVRYDF